MQHPKCQPMRDLKRSLLISTLCSFGRKRWTSTPRVHILKVMYFKYFIELSWLFIPYIVLGLRVAQLRLIFTMPDHLCTPKMPKRLAYIEWFTHFRAPNADSGFHSVSRSHQNRMPSAAIIPIDSIVSSCHLVPKFGTKFHPARWDSSKILDECTTFLLNKHISIATFYKYNEHLFVDS
jgi:hypothetical protein